MNTTHARLLPRRIAAVSIAAMLFASGCSQPRESVMIAEWIPFETVYAAPEASDLVVVGTVLDSSDDYWDSAVSFARTISTVQISEVLAGDANEGETIQVSQSGGERDGTVYREASTVLLGDLASEKLVLFLSSSDDLYYPITPLVGVQIVDDSFKLHGIEPLDNAKTYQPTTAPFPEAASLTELRTMLRISLEQPLIHERPADQQ